jgi:glycosyltransferase involved in cell wall biosynthesis
MPQAVGSSDLIMADSQSTADDVEAEFPAARGRVRVVHLGATRLAAGHERTALVEWGVHKAYVLAVGTLEPRKNLQRLLLAFAGLPEDVRKKHQLVLVGGKGWGGQDFKTLITALNLQDDVVLFGYATDAQLTTLYTHASCLAMPSLYEGFGLPLVEAMSCGTPVLASDISSLPEVAGDGGVLVDPHSTDSIITGLRVFLDKPEDRQIWAERARKQAAKFSWTQAADQAMQVFAEAIEERKGKLRNARSAIF